MSSLSVTLIDVGWGDSILIESEDARGIRHYALVDSNDSDKLRSSEIFLKRHFEKAGLALPGAKPICELVVLSHAHADHADGLKTIMQAFGTKKFIYPKSTEWGGLASLIRYANRSVNVGSHQAVDNTNILPGFGDVTMSVLWPPHDGIDQNNENNNSVVLCLALNDVSFVLTGDAEKEVWAQIARDIPPNTRFFKVPHHGSVNGTFAGGQPSWLDACPPNAVLGISSHVRPFNHPDREVIELFENRGRTFFRTDCHYHITISTYGTDVRVQYWH